MKERKIKWELLSQENKNFVEMYLKNVLKIEDAEAYDFLFPDYEKGFQNLGETKDLKKSAERILEAICKNERICIFGDYDCDGVPGVSLFRDFFERAEYKNVEYYIPHRHLEGYGLNKSAIKLIKESDAKLLVTLDLGTTNIDEINYANSLDFDVIVTDHHLPIVLDGCQVLPNVYGLINHKQSEDGFLDKNLCGTGTVFLLLLEVLKIGLEKNILDSKKFPNGVEKWWLDLVGIATIADMVPLVGLNRTLAIYGLVVLQKTKRPGLQKLFKDGGVDLSKANETDIAFTLAPRVNAASRMDHPKEALKVFSNNLSVGIEGAVKLEALNKDRKETTKNIMKKVYAEIDKRLKVSKLPNVLVCGSVDFNVGVAGIIAQNIMEKYSVNAFVWGSEGGESLEGEESDIKLSERVLRGSVRGRGDTNVVELMTLSKDSFLHYGGHEMSGGFSLLQKNIHDLENVLNSNFHKVKVLENKKVELKPIPIELQKIDHNFFNALSLIGPFGVGNPKPVFRITNIFESKFERFGKAKEHIKIILGNGKTVREAVKFFVDEKQEQEIQAKLKEGEIFFEVEAGYRTLIPRLKIILNN
jgi:single-stranded-DNA-specific exonuclease